MACNGARLLLRNVTVQYGTLTALDSVSMEVQAGEAVALVGPSGAGKTTLLKLFNGAVRPGAGEVCVDDRVLASLSPAELQRVRADTGFIYQDLNLIPNLRVIQNIVTGRFGRRSLFGSVVDVLFPASATTRNIYEVLVQVGIAEKLYQRTDSLSGGEQQRVAIARALYQQPRVLLCDEPVASVDPSRARAVLELLKKLSEENGLTLCVSLHNLELARELFPRLVAVREGRIMLDNRTDEITANEFTEIYRLTHASNDNHGGFRNNIPAIE
ncbi:MAG: hypothetical protein A3G96_06120 [Gammaproteobacteria bacterium RIFCSPLOWO2_12_FULL_52_10]|nr:MAG: hypothetical protein A3G96_06120 [Gammaproteobacteria bacterium RIFCSPLOWO2_12_FULL_52_10]